MAVITFAQVSRTRQAAFAICVGKGLTFYEFRALLALTTKATSRLLWVQPCCDSLCMGAGDGCTLAGEDQAAPCVNT